MQWTKDPESGEGGNGGRLDKQCGGADLKPSASVNENHFQGCQSHKDMHDQSTGEEKHE